MLRTHHGRRWRGHRRRPAWPALIPQGLDVATVASPRPRLAGAELDVYSHLFRDEDEDAAGAGGAHGAVARGLLGRALGAAL